MNVVSLISFRIRNSNSKHSPASGTDYAQRILLSSGAVCGFACGAFLSQRAVSRWGAHHRGRLAVSALLRASAAALVGVLILSGIDLMGPKAPFLLAILATGMGAQALIGQRVANAPWATTVVFTGETSSSCNPEISHTHLSSSLRSHIHADLRRPSLPIPRLTWTCASHQRAHAPHRSCFCTDHA